MPGWCQDSENGVRFQVYVQPNAKRTEVVGEFNGALKIRLNAPPVEGKANRVLLAWLADRLQVPVQAFQLETGQSSRYKRIHITAARINAEAVIRALVPPRKTSDLNA